MCKQEQLTNWYTGRVTLLAAEPVSNLGRADGSLSQKRVLLLKPRGFCAGVVRAIDIVKIALETFGAPIYVRREIVHNRFEHRSAPQRSRGQSLQCR